MHHEGMPLDRGCFGGSSPGEDWLLSPGAGSHTFWQSDSSDCSPTRLSGVSISLFRIEMLHTDIGQLRIGLEQSLSFPGLKRSEGWKGSQQGKPVVLLV